MRASIYLLLAFLSCSCAAVRIQTCGDSVPRLGSRGVTVISDVDDTIKDSHVKLGRTHIPNPAIVLDGLRTWYPVAGMARRYQDFWGPFCEDHPRERQKAEKGQTTIIYLSAGPCRYERRLRGSIQKWHFPSGRIVLRKGGIFPPHDYKTKAIDPIMKNSPKHHFVLIGDSGESDPECYGELARRFPGQVDDIYIRNISSDKRSRYERAFHDVAPKKIHFLPADLLSGTR